MKVEMMWQTGEQVELNDAAREKVALFVQTRLGDFRCPDHNQTPTIVCSGTSLENVGFDVKACCQKAVVLVKEKLQQ